MDQVPLEGREGVQNLLEDLSLKGAQGGVELGLDSRGPLTLVDESRFAKIITLLEGLLELDCLVDLLLFFCQALGLVKFKTGHLEVACHDDVKEGLFGDELSGFFV